MLNKSRGSFDGIVLMMGLHEECSAVATIRITNVAALVTASE